jgi:hypothetical protein
MIELLNFCEKENIKLSRSYTRAEFPDGQILRRSGGPNIYEEFLKDIKDYLAYGKRFKSDETTKP